MNKYIVDAWAWIEYFIGSEYGLKVNDILEDPTAEVYTCAITIAEVVSKTAREKRNAEQAYDVLLSNSIIIKIDEENSKQAGLFHFKMRQTRKDFGISDAFVMAASNKLEAKIITGDPHFKGLKNVILIK